MTRSVHGQAHPGGLPLSLALPGDVAYDTGDWVPGEEIQAVLWKQTGLRPPQTLPPCRIRTGERGAGTTFWATAAPGSLTLLLRELRVQHLLNTNQPSELVIFMPIYGWGK